MRSAAVLCRLYGPFYQRIETSSCPGRASNADPCVRLQQSARRSGQTSNADFKAMASLATFNQRKNVSLSLAWLIVVPLPMLKLICPATEMPARHPFKVLIDASSKSSIDPTMSYKSYHRQCVLLKRKEGAFDPLHIKVGAEVRTGLSLEDFVCHWRTTHADLVHALQSQHKPSLYTQTSRLTDNETFLEHAANEKAVGFDGLAALDFKDEEQFKAATASKGWTVGLREDGPLFSDRACASAFILLLL